jgi:hypothetical protein
MLSWTKHLVLCIFSSLLLDEPPMTIITFAIARRPTRTFDCQQRTILIAARCRGNGNAAMRLYWPVCQKLTPRLDGPIVVLLPSSSSSSSCCFTLLLSLPPLVRDEALALKEGLLSHDQLSHDDYEDDEDEDYNADDEDYIADDREKR